MAYNTACIAAGYDCTRLQLWSNPNRSYLGAAMGDEGAQNYRVLNDRAVVVANFRGSVAPAAPTNLAATPVSPTQINLSWMDNATNETGFAVERKTGAAGTWTQVATVAANVTSYVSTGLVAATNYSYRVRAYNGPGGSGDSNLASATTLALRPDLVISSIVLSPPNPVPGGLFSATVTVKNQGTLAGSGGRLEVWTHQATAPVCGAVGTQNKTLGTLAAGQSASFTFTGLSAGPTAGPRTFRAFVDSACATAESNETNNQLTKAYTVGAAQPDFLVTAITLSPATPIPGGTFSATVTVKNQGTVAGSANRLDVWTNQGAISGCGAIGAQAKWVGALGAGATASLTFTGLPAGTAGSKIFRGFIDSGCETTEASETNNQLTLAYSVAAAQPDLVVSGISLNPPIPPPGGTFSATVTVQYQGTAAGSANRLDVWTDQGAVSGCGAVGTQNQSLGSLGPGASLSLTFTGLPAGTLGAKTFRAFVDSGCGTAESNEANNQPTKAYLVGAGQPLYRQVSAGGSYSCALKADESLACWGSDGAGQATPPAGTFKAVSAGLYHSCGLRIEGSLACCGSTPYGQSIPPVGSFKTVSAGGYHGCALKMDDNLVCWGSNSSGQASPPTGIFKAVDAGDWHSCALKVDGSLACWGSNSSGQASPATGTFKAVDAGDWHTCALKPDDSLVCWGRNNYGQATPPSGALKAVSASGYHTCLVKAAGGLACWGANGSGQATPPTGVFKAVSAGAAHTCAMKVDDGLACWGWNQFGQASPPAGTFKAVTAGEAHSCALKADDGLVCWGDNGYGQSAAPTGRFKAVSTLPDPNPISSSRVFTYWTRFFALRFPLKK